MTDADLEARHQARAEQSRERVAKLMTGWTPGREELADAPGMAFWSLQSLPGGGIVLVGVCVSHPENPRPHGRRTSSVQAMDPVGRWALTLGGWYRLGEPAPRPAPAPIPEQEPESPKFN